MTDQSPQAIGRRRGEGFARMLAAGVFAERETEWVRETLEGHRQTAESSEDAWCRAYSAAFLKAAAVAS